jgi:hypothetical protein
MARLFAILVFLIALALGQTVLAPLASDSAWGSGSVFMAVAGAPGNGPCQGDTAPLAPSHACCPSCPHNFAVQTGIVPLRGDDRARRVELHANDCSLPSIILGRDPPVPRPLT